MMVTQKFGFEENYFVLVSRFKYKPFRKYKWPLPTNLWLKLKGVVFQVLMLNLKFTIDKQCLNLKMCFGNIVG